MSSAIFDNIIYRGETSNLIGALPLEPFLSQNKDIQFDKWLTSGVNHGYCAYWFVKDSKLFLYKIDSANYSFKDIFSTDEPVFADWYSGTFYFNFGECLHHGIISNIYSNAVWFKVEKGEVIEKKIIKNLYRENKIEFGKYNGRAFKDLFYWNPSPDIHSLIQSLLDLLTNSESLSNEEQQVLASYFKIDQGTIDRVNKFLALGVKCILIPNYIITKRHDSLKENIYDPEAEDLSNLLYMIFLFNQSYGLDCKHKIRQTNPDLSYLNWIIKNVDSFYVEPYLLNKEYELKELKSFETIGLSPFLFEYKPKFESTKYKFPEATQKINIEKFERDNNIKYDSINHLAIPDISPEEMRDLYGFYLDEDYCESDKNENLENNLFGASLDDMIAQQSSGCFRESNTRGDSMFYLGDYHPYYKGSNPKFNAFSKEILSLKQKRKTAISFFRSHLLRHIKEILNDNFLLFGFTIVTIPSHDPDIINGVSILIDELKKEKTDDPKSFYEIRKLIQNGNKCLVKTKKTEKMSGGGERSAAIIKESLVLNNIELINNKYVLLLDDVTTTGLSLTTVKRILMAAGAKEVILVALGKTYSPKENYSENRSNIMMVVQNIFTPKTKISDEDKEKKVRKICDLSYQTDYIGEMTYDEFYEELLQISEYEEEKYCERLRKANEKEDKKAHDELEALQKDGYVNAAIFKFKKNFK